MNNLYRHIERKIDTKEVIIPIKFLEDPYSITDKETTSKPKLYISGQ